MVFVNINFHPTIYHLFLLNFVCNIFVLQNSIIFPSFFLADPDLGARTESIMVIQHEKQDI